jgi:ketosteroid isomerase-like protein
MSRANVEVVQRWIDAYNRHDIDALTAVCDPDIEFRSIFVTIEPVFRGFGGIRSYFEALDEAYDHYQLLPIEFIDAGAAVVLAEDVDWRGKESGARGTTRNFPAMWFRSGKIFRIETFTDRGQALEAVGLSEEQARAVSSPAGGICDDIP